MSSSAAHRKSGKNGEHSSAYKSKALKMKPSKEARERRNRKRKVESDDFVQPQTHKTDLNSDTSSSDCEDETDCNDNKTNVNSQKNSRKRRRTSSNECCAICLEIFNSNNEKYFLNCGHYFHCPCIKQWLGLQKTCPTCRAITSDCDED